MRAERWASEATFFDRLSERLTMNLQPMDPRVVARYTGRLRRRFNKELRLKLLGNLQGQRVLDVGCGEGSNSVLLAKLGAHVTGLDISPKSVELARERAHVNGVSERTRFICSPVEIADLPANGFDIIWGDGILHHIIPVLDTVLGKLFQLARPDAQIVFSEPVNLSPLLRRIRLMLPIHTDATPDERPLEPAELAIIQKWFPELRMHHLGLTSRLSRFLLVGGYQYEATPLPRRALCNALHLLDAAVLSVPGLKKLGAAAVIHGLVRK